MKMATLASTYRTTFEQPIQFVCRADCGLCCSYKVHLRQGDLDVLSNCSQANIDLTSNDALPRQNGFCKFLNPTNRCAIYEHRPSYCRTFPFYLEDDGQIDIDLSCPGIGAGPTIDDEYLTNLYRTHRSPRRVNNTDLLDPTTHQPLLKNLPGYQSPAEFQKTGLDWCAELANVDSALQIAQSARSRAESNKLITNAAPQLFADFFTLTHSFNAHMDPDGKLTKYAVCLNDTTLSIDAQQYCLTPDRNQHLPIDPAAANIIKEYLPLWFRRGIFHRFCMLNTLSAPMLHSVTTVAFSFIATLVETLISTTDVLATHWAQHDNQTNDTDLIGEAIRMLDGRIRTKCRSVGIQTEQHT